MKLATGIVFISLCFCLYSTASETGSGPSVGTPTSSRVIAINTPSAVSIDSALHDIFEPTLSRQSAIQQEKRLIEDFCTRHAINPPLATRSALARHLSSMPVTRSQDNLTAVLLEVLEKSELLVQRQTQAIDGKDGEIRRQTTLLKDQQKRADKDKKKWACGTIIATLTALMAPLAPIIATAYSSIAGQCAEQCAELCKNKI